MKILEDVAKELTGLAAPKSKFCKCPKCDAWHLMK